VYVEDQTVVGADLDTKITLKNQFIGQEICGVSICYTG